MNLSLILLKQPTKTFAGVFTRNAFPGAPVIMGKSTLNADAVQGVFINNKIANVRAPQGLEDAGLLMNDLRSELSKYGIGGEHPLFMASTGIIGWRLPIEEMRAALPDLIRNVQSGNETSFSCIDVSRAIMTTDSFPKIRRAEVCGGSIVVTGKGAGMIEPNLATMLVFIMTDLAISRESARRLLPEICAETFNVISIDGDQSTSDMVLLFSSESKPLADEAAFAKALKEACSDLAEDIVRNGEGTSHVIKVLVRGAPSGDIALNAGKAIVNSPLVKTAVFGNDPNVGRILCALGDYAGNAGLSLHQEKTVIRMGGKTVFRQGVFILSAETERYLVSYLRSAAQDPSLKGYPQHDLCVEIEVDLGMGNAGKTIIGSDLSYEYVKENADYRS